jgi:NADP-dependent 3-hydroxy acid dehydrogenase YdfG
MTTVNIDGTDWSKISGKVIVITGGASGIGKAAVEFADGMNCF